MNPDQDHRDVPGREDEDARGQNEDGAGEDAPQQDFQSAPPRAGAENDAGEAAPAGAEAASDAPEAGAGDPVPDGAEAGEEPESASEQALPGLLSRLGSVLFSPADLFGRLKDEPRWFGVIAVVVVLIAGSTVAIPSEIWEGVVRDQLRASGNAVPDDLSLMANVARYAGSAAAAVFIFVMLFVQAGIVTAIFTFMMGDEGKFKQYLAVCAHAMVIPAIGALVTLPLKITSGNPQLSFSLATFTPFVEEGYLLRVLTLMDLFGLWAAVLIALGASRIDPKRSWSSGIVAMMIYSLVFALAFGALAGLAPGGS